MTSIARGKRQLCGYRSPLETTLDRNITPTVTPASKVTVGPWALTH